MIAAAGRGRATAGLRGPPRPANNRADAQFEQVGGLAARLAFRDGRDHALAQIERISGGHDFLPWWVIRGGSQPRPIPWKPGYHPDSARSESALRRAMPPERFLAGTAIRREIDKVLVTFDRDRATA